MKNFNSIAHLGGRFFAGVLCILPYAAYTSDISDIQPYLYTDVFARSEPISVMDTIHGWKGDHQRGEKQYIYSWFETGAKLNNWGLGVLYRRDYALNFSGDTSELYGAIRNDEDLPTGRTYDVDLKAHAITAKGLRLSWINEWQPSFKTTIGLSFLQSNLSGKSASNMTHFACHPLHSGNNRDSDPDSRSRCSYHRSYDNLPFFLRQKPSACL